MNANCDPVGELIQASEDWLVQRILDYARQRGYTAYTSTLLEAWRQSIVGLSETLLPFLARPPTTWELSPDEDLTHSPESAYAIGEARRHRERGVSLAMFLGLMKYYQECYQDLARESALPGPQKERLAYGIRRFFDRLEIGFCAEWSCGPQDEQIRSLQERNRALANEKNRFLTIFESLDEAVLVYGADGQLVTCNLAALKAFGEGAGPGEVAYGFGPALKLAPDLSQIPGDAARETEREFATTAGIRRFAVRRRPVLDFSEKFAGTVASLRDVSERHGLARQLERALRESGEHNAKLQQTLRRLSDAQAQLVHAEKMASVGMLAAGVAHEINNPVGYVSSNTGQLAEYVAALIVLVERLTDLADSDASPTLRRRASEALLGDAEFEYIRGDAPALLKESREGLARITRIVRQLLDFSHQGRDEASGLSDPMKCMETTLDLASHEFKHSVELVRELAPVPALRCSNSELGQVLLNLLTNAVQASAPGGRVVARCGMRGAEAVLEIEDHGSGIPAEALGRIFDPFFTTKEIGKGTGLGLSIARRLIEKNGGRIEVSSTPGVGTRVGVVFGPECLARSGSIASASSAAP